jgi:hypothetical protein
MHPAISGMLQFPPKYAYRFLPLSCRWDPVSKGCYFNNADPAARSRGLLGTQISWFIMAVGELGAFLIIVGYLVMHEVRL